MRPQPVFNAIDQSIEDLDKWISKTNIIEKDSRHYFELCVLISEAVKKGFDLAPKNKK